MKRIFSAVCALIMLILCFTSCSVTGNGTDTTDAVTSDQSEKSDTDATEPQKPEEISLEDLTKFSIVRPQRSSVDLINAMRSIHGKIKELYGADLNVCDDFYREDDPNFPMGEYEIVLGNSDRPETKALLSELRYGDYGYRLSGNRLVIAGHTDDTTLKAIEKFIEDFLTSKRDDGKFFAGEPYVFTDEYTFDELKLNGVAINEYTIVYARGSSAGKTAAETLYRSVIDLSGYVMPLSTEASSEGHNILIGDAQSVTDAMRAERDSFISSSTAAQEPNRFYIAFDGKDIWIYSESTAGLCAAVQKLLSSVKVEGSCGTLSVEGKRVEAFGNDEKFSVMSFNILTSAPDEARKNRVITMILKYMPDTFGVQEASPNWMRIFKNSDLMKYYDYVGVGRNGGDVGEYSAVFYRKDKFKLLGSGTKWLSPTPDTPNTKYDDSSYPRIMTYALLEDKATGKQLLHVNTHLEHTSSAPREKQIKVLLREVAKLGNYATIITGDFNDQRTSNVYSAVTGAGYLDAAKAAEVPDTGITFPKSEKVLDYVFFTPTSIYAKSFRVCSEKIDGELPSDHYPVFCEYCIY